MCHSSVSGLRSTLQGSRFAWHFSSWSVDFHTNTPFRIWSRSMQVRLPRSPQLPDWSNYQKLFIQMPSNTNANLIAITTNRYSHLRISYALFSLGLHKASKLVPLCQRMPFLVHGLNRDLFYQTMASFWYRSNRFHQRSMVLWGKHYTTRTSVTWLRCWADHNFSV